MDEKTKTALAASITKWQANEQITDLDDAKISRRDCPLCDLFFERDCCDCPVREEAGAPYCGRTPYADAVDALDDGDLAQFRMFAHDMTLFLIGLEE